MRHALKSTLPLLFAFLLLSGGALFAQNPTVTGAKKYPIQHFPKSNTVDLREVKEDWFITLHNTEKVHTQGDEDRDRYLAEKARLNASHSGYNNTAKTGSVTAADQPVQGTNFFGNTHDGIPNDNSMAISKDGIVVSATNSKVMMYDESGSSLATKSLSSFISLSGTKFDPKVTYDPDYDRFVLLFLNGSSSSQSRVVVCFSQTNDPTGAWNVYSLDGNPDPGTYGNVWTDFCQIGLSKYEYFIAGNLFLDSGGSSGRYVWQVDKRAGYNGDASLPVQAWGATGGSTFAMSPVEGSNTLTGPDMFLVSTTANPFGSTKSIFLHQITDTINGSPTFNTTTLNADIAYSLSPDGNQLGTSKKLDVRDCRVRSSYRENDRIHFGMNANGGGKSGIYFGTIEGFTSPVFAAVKGKIITVDSFDISFPGLVYGGNVSASTGDNATLVFFNFSSSNHYPGNGCIYIDETGTQSDPLVLKNGFTYMSAMSGSPERWGDYADAAPRHSNPGEVWVAGYIGYNSSSHQHGTWISQLLLPNTPAIAIDDPTERPSNEIKVFPNPAIDLINTEFEVPATAIYTATLKDLQGRTVKLLVKDKLSEGKAKLSFNVAHLPAGTYFITVDRESEIIYTKKVVLTK